MLIKKNNYGVISGYEIANLNFTGTQLVVLAACESGLGSITQTEGVLGLQRAFKLAGANKIMMSMWNANDLVTGKLMSSFYASLGKGKSAEDALEIAQKIVRKQYSSPYYWACFQLVE